VGTEVVGPAYARRQCPLSVARGVADNLKQSLVAEPVDVVQGGQFDLLSGAPRPRGLISSVLYSPITDSARALSPGVLPAHGMLAGVLLAGPSAPKSQYVLSGEFPLVGQR
jgi:hypothetical protein